MGTLRNFIAAMKPLDWMALVAAFVGAFFLTVAISNSSTFLLAVGVVLLGAAAIILWRTTREKAAELDERQDWTKFESALVEGVRFEIPEGMGYAADFPELLDDLRESGEPSDGEARHAILGEEGAIHWCAFQHVQPSSTATVGMVGLHPQRETDRYPDLRVSIADVTARTFGERFSVWSPSPDFAYAVLGEEAREVLMSAPPIEWRIIGNQILTILDKPCTPEQQIAFIENYVKPLTQIAERIPLNA